ncbi:MAG: EscU/YscU/HrcU family type III secretion system export apparatus switch protein, partial [Syntrophaceae bacterium]|nr:EscU/YscU/HrcU family type III secretion system export apparatus switch protein [Syntrophaceae bacterium]
MAKDPSKTEKATGKRREETRKKGQVAKSMEVTSVAILIASLVYFYFGTTPILLDLMEVMKSTFRESSQTTLSIDNVQSLLSGYVIRVLLLLLPLLLTLMIVGFMVNVFQVGLKITPEAIKPKLSKINPINGIKNLFSIQALAQLVKSLIKITVVGFVVYIVVKNEVANVFPLMDQSVWGILIYIGQISFKIIVNTCWVLLIMAILDYAFQKWQFEESIKMTKQEVKDEQRQIEGDPAVRGRIRNLQRQAARRRM